MDKQKDFEKGWEEYKAKKKQEIEEIYRLIDNNCALINNCIECQFGKQDKFDCDKLCIATAIINAGYRKIPKNAVVLTREEYDELTLTKQSIFDMLEERDDKARKETAEKFAERLKAIAKQKLEFYGLQAVDIEDIDEIYKEITEGEKIEPSE